MAHDNGRTALYCLYAADDALIYTGITADPETRFRQHAADKYWWQWVTRKEIEWFDSRRGAEAAEEAWIRIRNPEFNTVYCKHPPTFTIATEFTRDYAEGIDILCRRLRCKRENLIQMIVCRELMARGLFGEQRSYDHVSQLPWPDGLIVREALSRSTMAPEDCDATTGKDGYPA